MPTSTDKMLCMLDRFDARNLRPENTWQQIQTEIEQFMQAALSAARPHLVRFDAHMSIAIATGYHSAPKLCPGVEVTPLQRSTAGVAAWSAGPLEAQTTKPTWTKSEISLARIDACDVAVAVGVTHDVADDVRSYVERHVPSVKRIFAFKITPKPSSLAVFDGPHALSLAEAVVADVRKERSDAECEGVLHIFGAMPNGLAFRLGQSLHGLGCFILYEHEFDSGRRASYVPSMTFQPFKR